MNGWIKIISDGSDYGHSDGNGDDYGGNGDDYGGNGDDYGGNGGNGDDGNGNDYGDDDEDAVGENGGFIYCASLPNIIQLH